MTTTTAGGAAASQPTYAFAHPDYGCHWEEWKTVEDACAGSRQVKDMGTRYLPKLSEQTDDDYRAYKKRAVFFGATKRTKEALTGLLMRKQPVMTLPDGDAATQPLMADVTLTGMNVFQWIRTIGSAVVSTGRIVTVIDYNETLLRPYMVTYRAEDVLNWATGLIDGARTLVLLIVRECEEVLEGFTVKKVTRFRSYRIDEGVVKFRTWTENDSNGQDSAADTEMTRRGKRLTRIPAVFHNAAHLGPEIGETPLYDIAEINFAHYRGSADLENGRHIAGLPTAWATGVDDSKGVLRLGTDVAWTSEKENAKFGWLEFTGTGLGELTKGQEEKERQMAVLGARLLFDAKKDAESFETVKLRAVSETAALGNISDHMTVTTTQALQWFYWWTGTAAKPEDIIATCLMNKDFVDTTIDGATLQAYVSAFQQNAMSFDTFFFLLKEADVYPDGWTLEKEAAAIAQRPPSTMPVLPLDPNADPKDEDPPKKDDA